jgi:hypothetical protein
MKFSSAIAAAALTLSATAVAASDAGRYLGPDPSAPGWERIDSAAWKPNKAENAGALVGGMLAPYMEVLEGRPDVKVHVWKVGNTFRAAAKAIGIPDDSVSGEETVIAIARDGDGWTVKEVWRRWMCARGTERGNWTNKPCP